MPLECDLIPGPTTMAPNVLLEYAMPLGSADLDPEFWNDYLELERLLEHMLGTNNTIAIQSGEAMLALWGAIKSTVQPGDVVVCASNGVYGQGFADMARSVGAQVVVVESSWTHAFDTAPLIEAIKEHNPRLVTMVHCETPSGLLNSVEGVGAAIEEFTTNGLFLVDFVSSAMGAPVHVDEWKIDLGLLGPQKAMSGPPALAMTTVSEKAWARIREVKYQGYDALLPFDRVALQENRLLPYTHNWHAIRAALAAVRNIQEDGGVEAAAARHAEVAAFCREQIRNKLHLELYVEDEDAMSPTCTAVRVPEGVDWVAFEAALRARKVYVGGSYESLAGKVFRIGHMGTQADRALIERAVQVMGEVLYDMLP